MRKTFLIIVFIITSMIYVVQTYGFSPQFGFKTKNREKACLPLNGLTSGKSISLDYGKTYDICSGFTCQNGYVAQSGNCVEIPTTKTISNFGTYRAWNDGSVASSCETYRNPASGYQYSGAVGDGVYRINVAGTNYNVYCLMTFNSNGWMMIQARYSGATNTSLNDSYNSSQNFMMNRSLLNNYVFTSNTQFVYRLNLTGTCASTSGLMQKNVNTQSSIVGLTKIINPNYTTLSNSNTLINTVSLEYLAVAPPPYTGDQSIYISDYNASDSSRVSCGINILGSSNNYQLYCTQGNVFIGGTIHLCENTDSMFVYMR